MCACVRKGTSKGPGKRGHIIAETNVSPFARARNICCGHKFCVGTQKNVSDFVQKHFFCPQQMFPSLRSMETQNSFCVPSVCAPKKHHEQQCALVCQGLNTNFPPCGRHFGSITSILFLVVEMRITLKKENTLRLCRVIDDEFPHNIAKVRRCGSTGRQFTLTKCQISSHWLPHRINYKLMCLSDY